MQPRRPRERHGRSAGPPSGGPGLMQGRAGAGLTFTILVLLVGVAVAFAVGRFPVPPLERHGRRSRRQAAGRGPVPLAQGPGRGHRPRPRTGRRPSSHAREPRGRPPPCGSRPGWVAIMTRTAPVGPITIPPSAPRITAAIACGLAPDPIRTTSAVHLHLDPHDGPRLAGAPRL